MSERKYYAEMSTQRNISQLQQLMTVTWDGDLMDKSATKELWKQGLILRVNGWSVVNEEGIRYLERLGFIHP